MLVPVILSGGVGARLAPLSTPELPKPFLPLARGGTLLGQTCARVAAPGFAAPVIVGAISHRALLLRHGGASSQAVLLEPAARNTALAVAVAAAHALAHTPGAQLAILPCDHHIAPAETWRAAVFDAAALAAREEKLCLLGAPARTPRPGLGYLSLAPRGAYFEVARFVEKPADPAALLAEGDWAWNIGQFIAPAALFARLFATHRPDIWAAAQRAVARASREGEYWTLDADSYHEAAAISFDHAIAELAPCLALMPEITWDDLGTPSAWEAYNKAENTSSVA